VDFATLQVMAKEERLFVDDEIRDESSQEWISAGTVAGLFPEAADEDDLSSMLSDADMPAADEDRADSDDLCYCRTRTEELGPMPFAKLVSLARMGKIGRRDQVRIGAQGQWVEARSVASLFDEPVKPAPQPSAASPATNDAASMLDTFEIVADHTPKRMRAPRPAPEPVLKLVDEGLNDEEDDVAPVAVSDEDAMWHCRVLGQEIGPISWQDMRELVETRQLGPNDRVRKGQSVAWVPAATIDNLFPKRKKQRLTKKKKEKISEEDVLDILQPDEPEEEEEVGSHVAPQRSFGKPARKSSHEMPARPGARGSDSEVESRPAPPMPNPGLAAAIAATRGTAPPPRPAPAREKRKMGNPFSGLGSSLGNLSDGLASAGKPIAMVLAALLVISAVIYGGMSLFSGGGADNYEVATKLWDKAKSLRATKNQDGWQAFCDFQGGTVTGTTMSLEEEKGDPLADALLVCFKECLPKMMAAPIDGANDDWAKMEENMKKADTIARGG
jgi:hypothetical protein